MNANTSPLVHLQAVEVRYGLRGFVAVHELNLKIEQGTSFALLGPNGAGKTSTLRLILGMLRPRKGTVSVLGGRPGSIKALEQMGFAPEEASAPDYLSAQEYLDFVAAFRIKDKRARTKEVEELQASFELPPGKRVGEFSKGMRRKLILASAFCGKPKLLVLDEPLNGLDPLFIIKLRDKIRDYVAQGGTLLFSSHILAEVEKSCTEIGILKQGKLVCAEKTSVLAERHGDVEKAFAFYMQGSP